MIGVLGLGYVGLPLSLAFAKAGFSVLGMDSSQERIRELSLLGTKGLSLTSDLSCASEVDCLILCLPTPLNEDKTPDLSAIISSAKALRPHLKEGCLVVLESTTWPGTTRQILQPLLQHCEIAYSPERIDPGKDSPPLESIPKLLAGLSENAKARAHAIYEKAFHRVILLDSVETAEAAKLLENVFRAVNIALVNEMKVVLDTMGIDIWAVIDAAKTKPFGFMPFFPGPGLGGHCVPIDPYYLSWKAKQEGVESEFIELAGRVNDKMPAWVVEKTEQMLGGLFGKRILLLGIAYKANIPDMRESPARPIWRLLKDAGASVNYHDPMISCIGKSRLYPELGGVSSSPLSKDYDAFILLTAHSFFDSEEILSYNVPVIDTRRFFPLKKGVIRA